MNKVNRKKPKELLGHLKSKEIDFIEKQNAWRLLVANEAFFHDIENEAILIYLMERVVYALQGFNEDIHTGQVWWQVQTLFNHRGEIV